MAKLIAAILIFVAASVAHAQQSFIIGLCSDGFTGGKAVVCKSLRTEAGTHYKIEFSDKAKVLTPQDVKSPDMPITGTFTAAGEMRTLVAQTAPKADGSYIKVNLVFEYVPTPKNPDGSEMKFAGNKVWNMHFRGGTIQTVTK